MIEGWGHLCLLRKILSGAHRPQNVPLILEGHILSLSHIIESHPADATGIACTAVCSLNEFTGESIGKTLEAENHQNSANLYCFLDSNKLSVRVKKIRYN